MHVLSLVIQSVKGAYVISLALGYFIQVTTGICGTFKMVKQLLFYL